MLLASRLSRRCLCIRPTPLFSRYLSLEHAKIYHEPSSSLNASSLPPPPNVVAKGSKNKSQIRPLSFAEQWPDWNLVIGIEVHAQLKTRRKLFSRTLVPEDANTSPNERVSLFDAAFPGTLPVINPVCVSLATRTALALHADIQPHSAFDRKHYFYGDLPAGYQITQNYAPFAKDGYIQLMKGQKHVRIKQIQIEQDTAKSVHTGSENLYDLNRAGMPLLEIVSHPDISSTDQAGEYVRTLQAILRSIGVSDGMMEAGSLRCDVNVSLHRHGQPLGIRTEIKNLNSVKNVMLAINAEAIRQVNILTSGSPTSSIVQQTLTFDEDTLQTRPLRTKEGVEDYRYMPDPNLPILKTNASIIAKVKAEMADLGLAGSSRNTKNEEFGWEGVRQRLEKLLGITNETDTKTVAALRKDLEILMLLDAGKTVGWDGTIASGAVAFFEEVTGSNSNEASGKRLTPRDSKTVLNWVIHELLGQLTFRNQTFAQNSVSAQQLGDIIDAVEHGTITRTSGKIILRHVLDASYSSPKAYPSMIPEARISSELSTQPEESLSTGLPPVPILIRQLNLAKSSSDSALSEWCDQAIEALPMEAEKVRMGRKNVIMTLVGKVMKLSQGSADAVQARELLEKKLK